MRNGYKLFWLAVPTQTEAAKPLLKNKHPRSADFFNSILFNSVLFNSVLFNSVLFNSVLFNSVLTIIPSRPYVV